MTAPQSAPVVLSELRRLAEAARDSTTGRQKLSFGDVLWVPDYVMFLRAANPATILALLDELDEWRERGRHIRAVLDGAE